MNNKLKICPHAKKCGGCQLLNLSYEEQLKHKQVKTIRLLGKFCHVEEIIGMENPYNYRNKAQYAFGRGRNNQTVAGVYQSSTHKIVDIESCMLTDPKADEIANTVKKLLKSFKLKPYDENTRQGFLRHVLVKTAFRSGEVMVVLVTATPQFPSKRSFINALVGRHPEITTIVQNINNRFTSMVLGDKSEILYGDGKITEELCGLKFRISPKAFYQINPVQTEILYNKALEYADFKGDERIIDAYCGTGTIGLIASKNVKSVLGVEINKDAVKDAKENAKLNGIENIKFFSADAGKFMVDLANNNEQIDAVVMDPARAGSDIPFLSSLVKLNPEKVVYVSCNPETLARDLMYLSKNGYKVRKIQPVDMFPHTDHVEMVVLLSRQIDMHKMKLYSAPFEMIKSGKKTIELRLFDEKRQQVKVGDKIVFTNITTGEMLNKTVVKLHRFDNFEELYESLPLLQCGYTVDDVDNAKPSDMEQYYSIEEQKKYGVVGIELC